MIGASVITRGGLSQGFSWATSWGCESVQMYIAPSRTWRFPAWTSDVARDFQRAWHESGIRKVIAHSSLLLNLASTSDETRRNSIDHLTEEMQRAATLGIEAIVIHPGSHPDLEVGKNRIIEAIDEVLFTAPKTRLLLETVAGQGHAIGRRFADLRNLIDRIQHSDRVGICLDTCHVFAAGYDIRGYAGWHNVLEEFDRVIGLNRIECFHVNDSKAAFGSRVDRHYPQIGDGEIGMAAFHALLTDSRFAALPLIAEPPEGEVTTDAIIRRMKMLREQKHPICEGARTLFG
jgi:deoxyribonuclease IV